MYCAFRLNPEYDAELIAYLQHRKNRSRAIRELIRAGYSRSKDVTTKHTEEPKITSKQIVKQPPASAPEQQKNQPDKLIWGNNKLV